MLHEVPDRRGRKAELPLECTEDVTRAVRGALLHYAEDPPPAALSGHRPDGQRLDRPHVAVCALSDVPPQEPNARAQHESSSILGVAIVLPRAIDPLDRSAILLAAHRWQRAGLRVVLGTLGVLHLERVDAPRPLGPLDPETWTRPSRRWASVTPVALPRNPGRLSSRDPQAAARATRRAEEAIARACHHSGFPHPVSIRVQHRAPFPGAPPASAFAPYPRNAHGFQRVCVHTELEFAEPVAGPVLLGAGRYFGMGLLGLGHA